MRSTIALLALFPGVFQSSVLAQVPFPPAKVEAEGYEKHIELRWEAVSDAQLTGY